MTRINPEAQSHVTKKMTAARATVVEMGDIAPGSQPSSMVQEVISSLPLKLPDVMTVANIASENME